MRILVTGAAGFIGAHLSQALILEGHEVLGIDNFSNYYSVNLKKIRVANLIGNDALKVVRDASINDLDLLDSVFRDFKPEVVVNLAAQAGVRLPESMYCQYYDSNINGFLNISTLVRKYSVATFLYASSSSVYGNAKNLPFNENDVTIRPISVYGVTKLFNELHADVFFNDDYTKSIGMRFFTVYGPWGRPDMAYFRIINSLVNNDIFTKFGEGNLKRDFTYITDTINSIKALIYSGHRDQNRNNLVFNIGGGSPFSLNEMITSFESEFNNKLRLRQQKASKFDVEITFADYAKLEKYIGFKPQISLQEGAKQLAIWVNTLDKNDLTNWVNS